VTTITHILCPTDFSDTARHAVEQATAIARWYGARITLLHVAQPMTDVLPAFAMPDADGDLVRGIEELRRHLAHDSLAVTAAGIETDTRVDSGRPSSDIVKAAEDLNADLIVMGTHGATGFQHLLLGSVTEKVLRSASRPVLTVPPRAQTTATLPFRQVLCPVDFSLPSLAALEAAYVLAQEGQAGVTLLHVIQWPWDEPPAPSLQELPPHEAANLAEFRRYLETQARARLESLIPAEVRNWCTPQVEVVHGKAHREVLRVAGETHTDLIVIGVHGRNVVDRTLFGSTTNQVVRRATCPVLTIRG